MTRAPTNEDWAVEPKALAFLERIHQLYAAYTLLVDPELSFDSVKAQVALDDEGTPQSVRLGDELFYSQGDVLARVHSLVQEVDGGSEDQYLIVLASPDPFIAVSISNAHADTPSAELIYRAHESDTTLMKTEVGEKKRLALEWFGESAIIANEVTAQD